MICMQRTFHQKLFQPNIQEQKKAISLARFRPMDIKLKRHQRARNWSSMKIQLQSFVRYLIGHLKEKANMKLHLSLID